MKILVLCIANFCRSPVAETILRKMLDNNYEILSAGLSPMPISTMDKRSSDFLRCSGYMQQPHTPRKLSSQMIKSSDLILSMEFKIIEKLFNNKNAKNKDIKIFNYLDSSLDISDPYRIQDHDAYYKIMKDIEKASRLIADKLNTDFNNEKNI